MKKMIAVLFIILYVVILPNEIFPETPEWFKIIRPECRPPATKIERLEYLRKKYNISHDHFALIILGHPVTTKQLQIILVQNNFLKK